MLQEKYAPHDIEAKWQKYWEEHKTFKVEIDKNKPKSYVLEMFPYPSGNLHMGHVRNYSIGDVVARFRSMKGFNVLHPMGWDSFGMPAENAAIKHGIPPKKWTLENIANMTRQQKALGLSYDWDREVATCKEDYYKWTQWFFELFYKRGLAVKKKSAVNWCDTCNTVLANEQVIDGKCWRCDHDVVKKDLSQWFFKITDYADELLKDLDLLEGWPERVKTMQRNWIGRSEGLEFTFEIPALNDKVAVYTTRPDTAYGVTFMALAAEHPLIEKICENNPKAEEIKAFCERVRNQSDVERTSSESEEEGIEVCAEMDFYDFDWDDLALLDTIINESLNEYKILNFEYENNIYIKEDEINKMVASVLKNVLTKMSPLFLDKLSYIYNKNVLEDEILKKVRFSVLAYVTEVNGNYKG